MLLSLFTVVVVLISGSVRGEMQIVESMPIGGSDFILPNIPSVLPTATVLLENVKKAKHQIQICGMYWNLLGRDDSKSFNTSQLEKMGINHGKALYYALEDAVVRRNVSVSVIYGLLHQHSTSSAVPQELQELQSLAPSKVSLRGWNATSWYGGGIMHQKLWIFDQSKFYVGSANTDWKSLAQVLELGIFVSSAPAIVSDVLKLYNLWYHWASITDAKTRTAVVFDNTYQASLQVPCWSSKAKSCSNPFEKFQSHYNIEHQIVQDPNSHTFVSASPREAIPGKRTFDQDALVYTIKSAETSLCLSVMDYQASSVFPLRNNDDMPLYWPVLNDAILSILYSKSVTIRLLISYWSHTSDEMVNGLSELARNAALCSQMTLLKCRGSLEIRYFKVPGWDDTRHWASFSRVNHAKYIVSDNRVNIGTSNMQWGYFHTTAGMSFNTNASHVRDTVQAIFDRNWNSKYTATTVVQNDVAAIS